MKIKQDSKRFFKGFTLVELLVVISIVSLLSSIVLASLSQARDKGRVGAGLQFAAYNYHKLGTNLIGMWNFDEGSGNTAKDSSGNGYNLPLTGSATFSTSTPDGSVSSLSTGSSNGGANVTISPAISLMNSNSKGFTVSLWKYARISQSGYSALISFNTDMNNGVYRSAGCYSSDLFFYGFTGDLTISSNPVCTDKNKWHNLTYSYDNTVQSSPKLSVYVDGTLVSGSPFSYSINTTNITSIYVGTMMSGYSFINGNIDAVRIYNELLTASEVGKLYAEGLKTHQNLAEK